MLSHLTLDFRSGHDLTVRGIEPHLGLCADNVEPTWDSLSSLSAPSVHILSPEINKVKKKKKKKKAAAASGVNPSHQFCPEYFPGDSNTESKLRTWRGRGVCREARTIFSECSHRSHDSESLGLLVNNTHFWVPSRFIELKSLGVTHRICSKA